MVVLYNSEKKENLRFHGVLIKESWPNLKLIATTASVC